VEADYKAAIFPDYQQLKWYESTAYKRDPNKLNVLGISCTSTDPNYLEAELPDGTTAKARSTTETSLEHCLERAKSTHGCNTVLLKLRDIEFDFCKGYYSTSKNLCEWPCKITADAERGKAQDKMDIIYYGIVSWADIVLISTPIRYGNASALYYKMVERLNTVHNQMTLHDKFLIKDKVAGFVIVGGQDGVQGVAGQLLTFWSEIGFLFSRFSYVGWNRGWYSEDTRLNMQILFNKRANDPGEATKTEFTKDLDLLVDHAVDLKKRVNKAPSQIPGVSRGARADGKPISYEEYDPAAYFFKPRKT